MLLPCPWEGLTAGQKHSPGLSYLTSADEHNPIGFTKHFEGVLPDISSPSVRLDSQSRSCWQDVFISLLQSSSQLYTSYWSHITWGLQNDNCMEHGHISVIHELGNKSSAEGRRWFVSGGNTNKVEDFRLDTVQGRFFYSNYLLPECSSSKSTFWRRRIDSVIIEGMHLLSTWRPSAVFKNICLDSWICRCCWSCAAEAICRLSTASYGVLILFPCESRCWWLRVCHLLGTVTSGWTASIRGHQEHLKYSHTQTFHYTLNTAF